MIDLTDDQIAQVGKFAQEVRALAAVRTAVPELAICALVEALAIVVASSFAESVDAFVVAQLAEELREQRSGLLRLGATKGGLST